MAEDNVFASIENFLNNVQPEPEVPDKSNPLINNEESMLLIMSLAVNRGEDGFSEDEAEKILQWANDAKLNFALLELALEGAVLVGCKGNEVTFKGVPEGTDALAEYRTTIREHKDE